MESFAHGFQARHEGEVDDPEGVINRKIHNVFIEALGKEIQYYTALVRSLDSSLGNMLEALAINIARLNFEVHKEVKGHLYNTQTIKIAELLEKYKRHELMPSIEHYQELRSVSKGTNPPVRRHDSDYYLIQKETNEHHLIELKIGGDLDNKKARSEKEAIFEQYAILANTLPPDAKITTHFATGYNRFGEGKEWKMYSVRQFFAPDELMIGRDFWNFVCGAPNGYDVVLSAYRQSAPLIKDALESIKHSYLN